MCRSALPTFMLLDGMYQVFTYGNRGVCVRRKQVHFDHRLSCNNVFDNDCTQESLNLAYIVLRNQLVLVQTEQID